MQLEFDNPTHTYRIDGRVVPSVTQVLDPLLELDGIPHDVLEAARVFGTHVHEAVNLMVRCQLDWSRLDPYLLPCVNGAKNFLKDTGFIVLASELRVCSPKLRCAGTLDLDGILNEWPSVIDWKSTTVVPPTVGPQTSAYEQMRREQSGGRKRKRFCVQLGGQFPRGYKLHELKDPSDYNIFVSALNIHHWRAKRAH